MPKTLVDIQVFAEHLLFLYGFTFVINFSTQSSNKSLSSAHLVYSFQCNEVFGLPPPRMWMGGIVLWHRGSVFGIENGPA